MGVATDSDLPERVVPIRFFRGGPEGVEKNSGHIRGRYDYERDGTFVGGSGVRFNFGD
jgi:hypothetical protein